MFLHVDQMSTFSNVDTIYHRKVTFSLPFPREIKRNAGKDGRIERKMVFTTILRQISARRFLEHGESNGVRNRDLDHDLRQTVTKRASDP